jgi:hypothetical protein
MLQQHLGLLVHSEARHQVAKRSKSTESANFIHGRKVRSEWAEKFCHGGFEHLGGSSHMCSQRAQWAGTIEAWYKGCTHDYDILWNIIHDYDILKWVHMACELLFACSWNTTHFGGVLIWTDACLDRPEVLHCYGVDFLSNKEVVCEDVWSNMTDV